MPDPPAAFAGGRLETVTDQAALFTEVRRFFAALSATRPALLVLEDLHWADPASLELLRHLSPRLRRWPILLLITYRNDELTRHHPFAMQLPALVREADGLRLDLRRLDTTALRALIRAQYRLPVTDESRLVAYLDRHAEGNPLFTAELLRALQEEELLCSGANGWTLAELDRVVVSPFLRQVIESRFVRLGEAARQPLAVAAVIGQEVPLALWAEVANLDEEALLTIVERAVDAHLLEVDPDGRNVRFVHALTRRALFDSVLPPRRKQWHRRVGEALISHGSGDPDAVAYHFQAADDPRAGEWLLAAGDRAQRAYAWVTAAERLRAAFVLLENIKVEEQMLGRLACRIAFLKRFSDPAGAIEAIDDASLVAERIGDTILAAETHWLRGLMLCYMDQFRHGLTEMVAGIEALQTMPPASAKTPVVIQDWLASALPNATRADDAEDEHTATRFDAGILVWRGAALGRFLASAGHLHATLNDCERSVAALAGATATRRGSRAALAFASHGLGIAQAGLGRPDEARMAFAQARSVFTELGHHGLVAFTLLSELADVGLTYDAANPAIRRQLAGEAEAALERTGGALRPGISPRLACLNCLVLDGQWQEADLILRDLPNAGNAFLRREITAAHAILARHRGAPERAWEEINHLLPNGPGTEPGNRIYQEGLFLQRLAADLCLDRGDLPAARAWLSANDRWLVWSGSVLGIAEGRVTWARYHLAAGDLSNAHTTATEALTLASSPDQPLVRLATHRLLGEIESASEDHAAADAHFTAAIDLATLCDTPFERALTLLATAQRRLVTGRADEMDPLLDEVRVICDRLDVAPMSARVNALADQLIRERQSQRSLSGLTQRELEILYILPRGLSNAEIADILFVSPRTVQTHLSNLYAKLGVRGRSEAIAYVVGRSLV